MATQITWLGHSTFEIRLDSGAVILIDPWLTNPKFPAGYELERVDLLLITHGHSDHIADAVSTAAKFEPTVISNFEIGLWLASKGVKNVTGMNKGGKTSAAGCTIAMVQAQHSSSIQDGEKVLYGGEPAGFVVKMPDGRNFYHAGDTNVFSDMELIRRLYEPELAMLPIGDLYTMDPREAALACEFLRPKLVLPMHYGTFPPLAGTPEQLRRLLASSSSAVEVLSPEPGETISW
jgi:L-ascorbate metabolism protein UlaG (beta-lactamase superfamily)